MFTDKDLEQIKLKGISEEAIENQIQIFKTGFPWLKLHSPATIGNGIIRLSNKQQTECLRLWNSFQNSRCTIEKFQPASGAASRMFKNLYPFVNKGKNKPTNDYERQFFGKIGDFAFFNLLNKTCVEHYQNNARQLISMGRYADVVKALLLPEGMNYGSLPKALLQFHRAVGGVPHTPLEEQLEEGAQYAADRYGRVHVHFTISPQHRPLFEQLLAKRIPALEKVWNVKYHVTLSEQDPSTDTIAVNMDNTPCRDAQGNLIFRPAGHGALLQNLNTRDADVIFIKNIDNVTPLKKRAISTRYKKVLGGYLINLHKQIKKYLKTLDKGNVKPAILMQMLAFAQDTLCIHDDATALMNSTELAEWLHHKFNRPIRVCGVVPNEGEPGGGPYLAYSADGSYAPQILESAQVNPDAPIAMQMMAQGTHFNPVDLVCYVKDYNGVKFDLTRFVDHNTGFISIKSNDGVELKALELPGLWNGSMSDWITVFIEVPIQTFNPVKTVNDLLRNMHQYE